MPRGRIEYERFTESQLWDRLQTCLFELDPDYCWEGNRPHKDKLRSWREARAVFVELQTRARQSRLGF